jgi:subtilisin-like proprotein convertase family protein
MIMKTQSTINNLPNKTAATQRRIESVPLRATTKTNHTMKNLKIKLLVLLAAVSPLLLQAQTIESFTFTTNRLVPDGNFSGLSDVRNVTSSVQSISSLTVHLKVTGEYNGDLYAYLRHTNGFVILLNRVGRTASNPFGYGDSGFDLAFQTGATNGDIHIYQNITAPASGSPLTGIWDVDGRNIDPTNVTDLSVRSTSLTNFNGLNGAGEWTLYLADVESGGTNMLTQWSLDISGAASPTLAWTNPANLTYGAALSGTQLNAAATYGSTNVPGTFVYSSPSGTMLNAGSNQTISVTFTPNDTNSFSPVTASVAINVSQAPLTITANDANKIYGDALPVLTASYSGFVNGDTTSNLTVQETLTTSASAASNVGTYTITTSGATSPNYTIMHNTGTLTVNPAALVITAQNKSKVYGDVLPTFTAGYAGFVNGDDMTSLTSQAILATGATASSPVGIYPITANGAVDANYNISYAAGTLTVTPAAITVTADNKSKTYGAALPALTATYTGFVLNQSTNDLAGLATLSTTASSTSDVGTYPITASGATSPNYAFSYVGGTLTITQSLSSGVVASSANPALPGTNVTFTMTISAGAPGAGTPSGTVNFRIDGSIASSGTLSGGVATFTTSTLALGSHMIMAEYAGDLNFNGTTNALAQNQVINTPPVAGNDTIERSPTTSVKVRLSTLLANDSDADGDTLNIVVSPTSASNAIIRVSGGWVFYTPPAGFTNADSFTYTITDGRGGNAVGTVTVAIKVDNSQSQNLTITDLGNGLFRINGDGISGYTYRLQYSDTIAPFDWQDMAGGSVTADSTGKFEYTDTTAGPTRFYRTVYP